MLNDNDGEVSIEFADLQNVVHQFLGLVMRHAGRRLVEQEQFWLTDQRAADLDAAPVDHRQPGDRLEHPLGKAWLEYFDERARCAIIGFELALELAAAHQIEPEPLVKPFVVADHDVVEDR